MQIPIPSKAHRRTSWRPTPTDTARTETIAQAMRSEGRNVFANRSDALRYALEATVQALSVTGKLPPVEVCNPG